MSFGFQGVTGAANCVLGALSCLGRTYVLKYNCVLQCRKDSFEIVEAFVDRSVENSDLQRCDDLCIELYLLSLVTLSHDEEYFMAENVNIPERNLLFSLNTELISHARLLC